MSQHRAFAWGTSLVLGLALSAACSSSGGGDGDGDGNGDGDGDGDGDSALGGAGNGDGDLDVGDGDEGPIVECAEGQASAKLLPANLLFVVDKSGSMNCNPPPIDNTCITPEKADELEESKWEITQQALTGAEGALQTLSGQEGVSVGLLAFPTDDYCAVPEEGDLTVPIDALTTTQLEGLTTGLTLEADGQTPLAGAAIRGLAALRNQIDAGTLSGNHYLVLMTDGTSLQWVQLTH
jgi:hypothetical protein